MLAAPTDARNDNSRILQYLAKYTINPARTHGIDGFVGFAGAGQGSGEIVLWRPEASSASSRA